ncbi:MAG: ATP-binding cassette domain-containing protein [Deltaproteobacteria bacterium]|nr:ATP-binding cassette domain-containing protein [Deltaproteobacteria bacterium]MBW2395363.1 ATP-binding cassette domain-containing protein [Deltaproteobacteria bacterium]
MAELVCRKVSVSFGGPMLLDGIDLAIEEGQRVGLLGRNGCGKSTLLRILGGTLAPDEGELVERRGVRVAGLEQEVPRAMKGTVTTQLESALAGGPALEEWEVESRIHQVIGQLGLQADAAVAAMSAGSKRRVLLARALVMNPDVLLLDEPTNHLDVEAIRGLEEFLQRRSGSLVFVTHDRTFLQSLATRIVDLDRGVLRSYDCDYETYLERRDARLEVELNANAQFDKLLAREEAWVRQGLKARRTRNMGRVRALEGLRKQRDGRREEAGRVRAQVQEAERSGKVVIRAKELRHGYQGQNLFDGFSCEIQRGDRIGILGPNGCGKTTLLQILLKEIEPDAGSVLHGTKFAVARFDQLHSVLDETKTVQENVCDEGDLVTVGGKARHVMGYLGDFLFTPEQVRGPITRLSGGERSRLQLARLLARPCNVLVLDEPTNDLDLETLELLEELLLEFQGTLLLVSHDRAFLDNVVTSTLVFEGDGELNEYVGGYRDWLRVVASRESQEATKPALAKARPATPRTRKPSYKEKTELEGMPSRIESMETEKREIEAKMADPSFYRSEAKTIARSTARLQELVELLEQAYARWEELEAIGT